MNPGVYDTVIGNLITIGVMIMICWAILWLRDLVEYIDGDDGHEPPALD